MANQTITTAVNYDDPAIANLLPGETITNNGGSLTINSDVRWAQQAAVLGNITCSAVLGGSVLIDGTTVWELPFTASTGNVPALGALGTNGVTGGTSAATGELLRVWATGVLTPAAAGGAMPATGFIKLRTTVGTFQAGEVVTLPGGATVTIANAGRRSWLHIVGAEAAFIIAARVSGTCQMTGDWYELGTTNGLDDQTFQFPVADYCPAIQIETAVGSGVYEWWLYADNRWGTATQFVGTDLRGKYFGLDPTTGVITIARRATNPCGFKPVSGLRVRVPNLICSSSSSANWNANTFSATVASRYRGITVSGANASAYYDRVCSNWDIPTTTGQNWTMIDSASMPLRTINAFTDTISLIRVGIGCMPNVTFNLAVVALNSSKKVIITDCRIAKRESGDVGLNDQALSISTVETVTLADSQFEIFGATGSQTRSGPGATVNCVTLSRCGATTYNNLTVIGGHLNPNTHTAPSEINGITFADYLVGSNVSTGALVNVINIGTCTDFVINGPINWFGGLSGVQPRNAIIAANNACVRLIVDNIGSSASPLDLGNQSQAPISLSDSAGTIFRRYYAQNSRSNFFLGPSNTYSDTDVDNCGTDYADLQQLGGVRTRIRGLKSALSTTTTSASLGTNVIDLFTSATAGRIVFGGGDPDPTNPRLVVVGGAGAGAAGNGTIILPNLNDTATWESAWFHLGHTGLTNTAPVIIGTNTGNFTLDFQYDLGAGWNGTWLAATGANLSGVGAINPATGIKMKLRATASVANSTNAIGLISVITDTTSVAQDTLYPLPFDATGTLDNLLAGSRVQIYNEDTSAELFNGVIAGTSTAYQYYDGTQVSAGDTVRIRVAKLGHLPQTLLAVATAEGFAATANQQTDTIYVGNGIDGSAVTEFSPDYPNVQMDVSDPDGYTTVQRVYAWLRYIEATSQGIDLWFDVVTPTDAVNYLIDAAKLNLKIDNTGASPVVIGGGRIYRTDGATVIAATSGSIQMDPARVYVTEGGATQIASAVLTAAQATPIHADIQRVNNVEITGTGVSGDSMRPV